MWSNKKSPLVHGQLSSSQAIITDSSCRVAVDWRGTSLDTESGGVLRTEGEDWTEGED